MEEEICLAIVYLAKECLERTVIDGVHGYEFACPPWNRIGHGDHVHDRDGACRRVRDGDDDDGRNATYHGLHGNGHVHGEHDRKQACQLS